MEILSHMMNIKVKFKVNLTTYFFFLIAFLCGYFKNILMIFFLVFFHELGHLFFIKIFHYKMIKVEFYPFGGITEVDKPINSSINKELLISLGGIIFQAILSFFLPYLPISNKNYSLLSFYNKTLFWFNILPIIPLDGSVFLHAFLEKFFAYKKSFYLYQVISCVCFFLFFLYNVLFSIDNYFICVVLFVQFFLVQKKKKYFIHRFYLERFLYSFPYKKIQNQNNGDISELKKETRHFFYEKNRYKTEKEKIMEFFQKVKR